MDSKLLAGTPATIKAGFKINTPGKALNEIVENGFFTVDRKWTVTYWNKSAEKLLGVRAKDILGKNLWEKFAGTIPLDFYIVYHKAFLQDVPVHFEEYWPEVGAWFDVITYYYDNTLSVSFKSSKQPSVGTDPVNQLTILNELYRVVTEITNDCLWEWDLINKEIFWIDGGHKRVFGYPIENALIPQSFWESCLHPDDQARVLSNLDKIFTLPSGTVWEEEYRFKMANGEYAYVHDRAHICYDTNKRASRMIGATQDISRRKIAEIDLLDSERKLSLIARQTINSIIITDNQQKISWVNSAFSQITGYEPDEVIGKKLVIFLQGNNTDPSTLQYVRKHLKSKEPFTCEMSNDTKSGRLYWLRMQGQPLMQEHGSEERCFIIGTDITDKISLEIKLAEERRAVQREITNAILTAQENERTEIGRDLHDNLNQMLVVSKMYLKMAMKNEGSRELHIEKSYGLVTEVIEAIRRIAKNLVVPGIHIIGLTENIKILVKDLKGIHPLKIEFTNQNVEQEDLGEKMQLVIFRIVQEQMNNILKHSGAEHASIHLSIHHDEVILLISDDGKGCDIMNAKNGVGLMNIKSRAELYFGNVAIASKPGQGFELKVILRLPDQI